MRGRSRSCSLTEFELASSVTTTKGVIIAQYTRRQGSTVRAAGSTPP